MQTVLINQLDILVVVKMVMLIFQKVELEIREENAKNVSCTNSKSHGFREFKKFQSKILKKPRKIGDLNTMVVFQ